MRRYIWLGDSKYGGSVYWDKKRGLALRNSKTSARNIKLNIGVFVVIFLVLIGLRLIIPSFLKVDNTEEINTITFMIFTLFFTISFTLFIYHAMYGNHKDYEETSLDDAMNAIKSTGYLKNPFIYMILDKKLHVMVIIILVLFTCSILCQLSSKLELIQNIIKIPFMIIYIATPIRMVYLVNFKKDNRLKL